MFSKINTTIESLRTTEISAHRKKLLQLLIDYIQEKYNSKTEISLNFICTHNSRRSHLSQVWAQALANYFKIPNVFSYSGGTEATALFPMAAKTLENNGFEIYTIAEGNNPIYAIKYSQNT